MREGACPTCDQDFVACALGGGGATLGRYRGKNWFASLEKEATSDLIGLCFQRGQSPIVQRLFRRTDASEYCWQGGTRGRVFTVLICPTALRDGGRQLIGFYRPLGCVWRVSIERANHHIDECRNGGAHKASNYPAPFHHEIRIREP
ncbi:hypothetical protein Acsp02_80100 [Actinoplanes sp. NBRC 103695]|nr:hypothetical protein Acsp02_80100 [Actinoplanes sp. NBRC 103695]